MQLKCYRIVTKSLKSHFLFQKYDESFVVFDYLDFYGANIQRYLNSTESS